MPSRPAPLAPHGSVVADDRDGRSWLLRNRCQPTVIAGPPKTHTVLISLAGLGAAVTAQTAAAAAMA